MGCKLLYDASIPTRNSIQAIYLLIAVLAACLGQFILRIRPEGGGVAITLLYLASSLLCYGTSFGITAAAMPAADRKLAVLILSLQYPLLYILFAIKDSADLKPSSIISIALGYAIAAAGMFRN